MAATTEFPLLCLENPLLDIQGQGDAAMLEKYRLKANDAILADPEKHMGLYEDLIQNRNAKLIAGGAAQNTARGAAYSLPPSSVIYIGCVGADKYADLLRTKNAEAGVRSEYLVDSTHPTGRCGVIITDQNRSMCTHLAAANEYKISHLQSPAVWSLVGNAKFFYVGGYHLTVCVPAVIALAEHAAKENKVFAMSFSAPFIPQFFKEGLDKTAPYWDYVMMNETEAGAWASGHDLDADKEDLGKVARAIAELPKENKQRKRVVIVTHGTEPAIVAVQGEGKVREYPVRPVKKEEINDTNGAGDAFAGGFMAGVVQGKDIDECVDRGQWLAALSIKELGPSYPFPKQAYTALHH